MQQAQRPRQAQSGAMQPHRFRGHLARQVGPAPTPRTSNTVSKRCSSCREAQSRGSSPAPLRQSAARTEGAFIQGPSSPDRVEVGGPRRQIPGVRDAAQRGFEPTQALCSSASARGPVRPPCAAREDSFGGAQVDRCASNRLPRWAEKTVGPEGQRRSGATAHRPAGHARDSAKEAFSSSATGLSIPAAVKAAASCPSNRGRRPLRRVEHRDPMAGAGQAPGQQGDPNRPAPAIPIDAISVRLTPWETVRNHSRRISRPP